MHIFYDNSYVCVGDVLTIYLKLLGGKCPDRSLNTMTNIPHTSDHIQTFTATENRIYDYPHTIIKHKLTALQLQLWNQTKTWTNGSNNYVIE